MADKDKDFENPTTEAAMDRKTITHDGKRVVLLKEFDRPERSQFIGGTKEEIDMAMDRPHKLVVLQAGPHGVTEFSWCYRTAEERDELYDSLTDKTSAAWFDERDKAMYRAVTGKACA